MVLPINPKRPFPSHRRLTGFRLSESGRDMLNYLKQISGLPGDEIIERLISDEVARMQQQLRSTRPPPTPSPPAPELYSGMPQAPAHAPPPYVPAAPARKRAAAKKR